MSDAIMRKSYTVVCVRSTGQQMDLATLSDYTSALNSAKEALTNKNNTEVRIVESKYDQASRKDKKQVIKILTAESSDSSTGASRATRNGRTNQGISRETANRASKGIINIVIAITVLVLLAGIMIPMITR
ncbi:MULTISPECIES: hypothetical protein [Thalassospira]|uniref:Uncharacterized protein n=2 Tax=Thalassospira TaxID=168934 RepID=A0A367W7R0_9PROT|nr:MULTISPECIES: hypothetical protein [Thalassospira]MDG4720973.1 hypothetical protein [Thalassospira sp. FZY0004]RCK36631.1 hypothetical protein TH19_11920 [Thalassospira profundimaris]